MNKWKAILFDFDGVIANTMDDNARAWENALTKYHIRFNKEEYLINEGFNGRKVVEHFSTGLAEAPLLDVAAIIQLKEQFYLDDNHFSFYAGVESLLPRLKKKGYLLGLVTAANQSRLLNTVKREVYAQFDTVVTGDKVTHCKPHPEPYANAAKALTVSHGDCLVVENAPLGIASARAAGMYCIAIASTLDKKHLLTADMILDKISELEDHV